MPQKLTQEAFLERCIAVHGDRYDYSKAVYATKDKPVTILCPIHGPFEQTPNNHWKGKGCWKCSGVKPLTQDEFLERARLVHGDKYDYSKTIYTRNNVKVIIVCPEHGEFKQIPMAHMKGVGCPLCGNVARSEALMGSETERVKKIRRTCVQRYGVENPVLAPGVKEKMKQTCVNRYGVDNYRKTEECSNRIRVTNLKRYGATSFAGSDVGKKKIVETNRTRYGVSNPMQLRIFQERVVQSKRKNGSFNTSRPEDNAYRLLCERFSINDVVRQYKSMIYPFCCDFYVQSLDLYIELNIMWVHGGHFFDENDVNDVLCLQYWISKAEYSKYYEKAIEVWTKRDIQKRDCAIKNHLNYMVFWDENLSDFRCWLKSLEI